MAVKSWPYVGIRSDPGDPSTSDRLTSASDEAQGYDLFVRSGVVPGIRDELGITKVSGTMQIRIAPGAAIIAGRRYIQDEEVTITLGAGGAQQRVDIIALESNANTPVRAARFVVVQGELSETEAVYQQEYARVTVPAGASSLDSATLTNTRVYASGRHSHDMADVTGLQAEISSLQTSISGKANAVHTHTIANVTNLQTTLNGKANSSHTHTIANVTGLQSELNGKSNTSHTHDSRYYTESEVDTKLSGKSNTSHTHDARYYTESEMDTKLNAKQDSLATDQRRKITISSSAPSGGSNGDIWLRY